MAAAATLLLAAPSSTAALPPELPPELPRSDSHALNQTHVAIVVERGVGRPQNGNGQVLANLEATNATGCAELCIEHQPNCRSWLFHEFVTPPPPPPPPTPTTTTVNGTAASGLPPRSPPPPPPSPPPSDGRCQLFEWTQKSDTPSPWVDPRYSSGDINGVRPPRPNLRRTTSYSIVLRRTVLRMRPRLVSSPQCVNSTVRVPVITLLPSLRSCTPSRTPRSARPAGASASAARARL